MTACQHDAIEKQRSARIWQEISHGLVLLPPFQKISGEQMVKSTSQSPQKVRPLPPQGADLFQVLTRSLFVLSLLLVPY